MNSYLEIPDEFIHRTIQLHRNRGREWLSRVPKLLSETESKWGLKCLKVVSSLSYNLVIHAIDLNPTGGGAILKLGLPGDQLDSEILSLLHYAGNGAARLLNYDRENGVLLLEQIYPGISLAELWSLGDDYTAVEVCCDLISQLHQNGSKLAPDLSLSALADRGVEWSRLKEAVRRGLIPFDVHVISMAEETFQELLASTQKVVLLHGDLHHANILKSTRNSWLVVDPQGVLGDPAFEVAAFMRNPVPGLFQAQDPKAVMKWRMDLFADRLGFDKRRIWGWSFCQTLLASWWVFEDHGSGWEEWYSLALILQELKPHGS